MGIRINKMIGYGLTDVAHQYDDPRINLGSPLLTNDVDATLDAYLGWLDTRTDPASRTEAITIRSLRADSSQPTRLSNPLDAVVYDHDYQLAGVLCVRPVYHAEWRRHDDLIDEIEDRLAGDPAGRDDARITVLGDGLYPYHGEYMDSRTGVRLDPKVREWVGAQHRSGSDTVLLNMLARFIRPEGARFDDRTRLFDSHAVAVRHVAPSIPIGVRMLTEWGRLFTSPAVVWELRPMLYVWWS